MINHLNNRELILGLGKTGYSLARYFSKNGRQVDVFDTRDAPPYLQLINDLDNVRCIDQQSVYRNTYKEAYISPGLSRHHDVVRQLQNRGVTITSDLALFGQKCQQPIMTVTGSNGKSSVISMMHFSLARHGVDAGLGGNIGKPVVDFLGEREHECYCIELSSFQLETVSDSLQSQVACVLNVSEDHMDRYTSFSDYAKAKRNIYRGAGALVANLDDAMTWPKERSADVLFSLVQHGKNIIGVQDSAITFHDREVIDVRDFRLIGMHNVANVQASLGILYLAGYPIREMAEYLTEYTGLSHRFELVGTVQGVRYINDSKATNVGATRAALASCAAQ